MAHPTPSRGQSIAGPSQAQSTSFSNLVMGAKRARLADHPAGAQWHRTHQCLARVCRHRTGKSASSRASKPSRATVGGHEIDRLSPLAQAPSRTENVGVMHNVECKGLINGRYRTRTYDRAAVIKPLCQLARMPKTLDALHITRIRHILKSMQTRAN